MGAVPHKMLPYFKSTGPNRRRWYNWQVERLHKKLSPAITVGHGDIDHQDVLTLHNCVFLASELIHQKTLSEFSEMASIHGKILRQHEFKKMIANSELMKADTIKRFGIDSKDIHVVYPALDTQTFFPRPNDKKTLRTRFGFTEKIIVALVTSGNFKKRGLDLFIEAIHQLPEEILLKADFRIVGKDASDQFQDRHLTFDAHISDIQAYYNAIDIFILPARIEEFGRVVLEAMGCGLPVITTDKVGAGELLDAESRAFVIPSHDSKALAQAMEKLIVDPKLRNDLGQINFRSAQKYTEDKLFPKFDHVFQDILEKNPGASN
jgi:UDP-glucose:(heptosyl)LPS alpha-1,3-glucosyltransferase